MDRSLERSSSMKNKMIEISVFHLERIIEREILAYKIKYERCKNQIHLERKRFEQSESRMSRQIECLIDEARDNQKMTEEMRIEYEREIEKSTKRFNQVLVSLREAEIQLNASRTSYLKHDYEEISKLKKNNEYLLTKVVSLEEKIRYIESNNGSSTDAVDDWSLSRNATVHSKETFDQRKRYHHSSSEHVGHQVTTSFSSTEQTLSTQVITHTNHKTFRASSINQRHTDDLNTEVSASSDAAGFIPQLKRTSINDSTKLFSVEELAEESKATEDDSYQWQASAEREQAVEHATIIFHKISTKSQDGDYYYLPIDKYPKIIKALEASFIENNEMSVIVDRIRKTGKILQQDFILWHVDMSFGDDLNLSQDNDEDEEGDFTNGGTLETHTNNAEDHYYNELIVHQDLQNSEEVANKAHESDRKLSSTTTEMKDDANYIQSEDDGNITLQSCSIDAGHSLEGFIFGKLTNSMEQQPLLPPDNNPSLLIENNIIKKHNDDSLNQYNNVGDDASLVSNVSNEASVNSEIALQHGESNIDTSRKNSFSKNKFPSSNMTTDHFEGRTSAKRTYGSKASIQSFKSLMEDLGIGYEDVELHHEIHASNSSEELEHTHNYQNHIIHNNNTHSFPQSDPIHQENEHALALDICRRICIFLQISQDSMSINSFRKLIMMMNRENLHVNETKAIQQLERDDIIYKGDFLLWYIYNLMSGHHGTERTIKQNPKPKKNHYDQSYDSEQDDPLQYSENMQEIAATGKKNYFESSHDMEKEHLEEYNEKLHRAYMTSRVNAERQKEPRHNAINQRSRKYEGSSEAHYSNNNIKPQHNEQPTYNKNNEKTRRRSRTSSVGSKGQIMYKDILLEFYKKNNPNKNVDELLKEFKGNEQQLFLKVAKNMV